MLAKTWTGGAARFVPYGKIQEGVNWVERAYLDGKLPIDELLVYEAVTRGLPKQYEADPETED